MIKKYISIPCSTIIYLLFFISAFSYSHLNWREDLFLFALICLYVSGLIFRRTISGIWNNFLFLILIFLLSQFYINDFYPDSVRWWFVSIPGWLTSLIIFLALISLTLYRKARANKDSSNRVVRNINKTLYDVVSKITPAISVVGMAMLFLFVLNIDEFSPQGKLVPDYAIYIIIAFGFALFYSLDFCLKHVPLKKMEILLRPAALMVLIFLVGIGAIKIYPLYTAYGNALRSRGALTEKGSRSQEKLWQDVLELNRIPKIQSIETKVMNELGKINMEQGNFRQASSYYEKILADQAFNFEANLGLAHTAFTQKKWRKACEAYKRAIYLRPRGKHLNSPYIHACIRAEKIDKSTEFISKLKKTRLISLYEPEDYLILGDAFFRKGRMQEAIGYLHKAKEFTPQNYKVYFLLGRAYLESRQYADGCEVLEKTVQLKPNFTEGYYYLGLGYENINQDHKAVEALEKLVLMDNENIKAFYRLKRLYVKMGWEDKAIEVSNLIENTATRVIEAADWRGRSSKNVYRNGNMYWKGTVSVLVFLKEGDAKFILQARGTPAENVWPHMMVRLNDEIMGEVDVTSQELTNYEFKRTVDAGKYQLSVSFMNDRVTLDKKGKLIEDRNLFVRRCKIVYEK